MLTVECNVIWDQTFCFIQIYVFTDFCLLNLFLKEK